MIDNEDKIRLLSGLPVKFGNSYIEQKSIKEIIEFGVEEYYNMCFPFLISLEFLDVDIPEGKSFDIFLAFAGEKILGKNFIQLLMEALAFFFDTQDIEFDTNKNEVKINKVTVINRDNFDELSKKIMAITKTEKLKKDEKKDLSKLSEKARRYFELQKQYEKSASKEDSLTNSLYSLINYLVHFSDTLDYKGVVDLTMYQANNSIVVYSKKDKYRVNLSYHFAGAKINKKDLKHWSS